MADQIELPELTAEQEEALFQKKFGVGSEGLMKKEDAPVILNDDQKKEAEEKKQNEILKFGLENNFISAKVHQEYIADISAPKWEIAKKQFIDTHKELGEKAGEIFEKTYHLNEDDEIEVNERFEPNENKKIGLSIVDKLAEEAINSKYSSVIGLGKKYEDHLAKEKLKAKNSGIITKAFSGIDKRLSIDDEVFTEMDIKIGIDVSDDDFKEAQGIVNQALLNPDLKEEEVKGTAVQYLLTKNIKRFVKEAATIAYAKGREDEKRGAKGLSTEDKSKGTGGISAKRAALIKSGIMDAPKPQT